MKKIIQDHSSLKRFRFKSLIIYSENQFSLLSQYSTGVLHLGRRLRQSRRVFSNTLPFLLIAFSFSCSISKNSIESEFFKIYSDFNKMKHPQKPLHEYEDIDFIIYRDYHTFRAEYDKNDIVTAGICQCLSKNEKLAEKYFKMAIHCGTFSEENLPYLHQACQKTAEKALQENPKKYCTGIEEKPEVKSLKKIFYWDQKDRTYDGIGSAQEEYDSMNFIEFKKLLPFYLENFYCLRDHCDSIPHARLIYAHNSREKGDEMLPDLYKACIEKRFSFDEMKIIYGQRMFRFPVEIKDNVKYFCLEDLFINHNKIDFDLSSFEIASFIKYLRDSPKRKVVFFVNDEKLLNAVNELIMVLKESGLESTIFETSPNSFQYSCKIGYTKE